jgi:hypothetical protein
MYCTRAPDCRSVSVKKLVKGPYRKIGKKSDRSDTKGFWGNVRRNYNVTNIKSFWHLGGHSSFPSHLPYDVVEERLGSSDGTGYLLCEAHIRQQNGKSA